MYARHLETSLQLRTPLRTPQLLCRSWYVRSKLRCSSGARTTAVYCYVLSLWPLFFHLGSKQAETSFQSLGPIIVYWISTVA